MKNIKKPLGNILKKFYSVLNIVVWSHKRTLDFLNRTEYTSTVDSVIAEKFWKRRRRFCFLLNFVGWGLLRIPQPVYRRARYVGFIYS
jgi:hypothetical protein